MRGVINKKWCTRCQMVAYDQEAEYEVEYIWRRARETQPTHEVACVCWDCACEIDYMWELTKARRL